MLASKDMVTSEAQKLQERFSPFSFHHIFFFIKKIEKQEPFTKSKCLV